MFVNRLFYSERPIALQEDGKGLYLENLNRLSLRFMDATGGKRALAFCLCQNNIPSLAGYISMLQNGIVPVMLDANKDSDLLLKLFHHYRPQLIWCPSRLAPLFDKGVSILSFGDYSLFECSHGAEGVALHPDLALLLTTSGSTGSPKLVRLSYKNVQSNAESIAWYLNITADERPITSLPMYYSYGLSVINSHLLKGATILLTDKAVMQKEFWAFAKEREATSMAGVPYTYEMLHRLRFFRMDLPHLKTLTQAGGKLNPELAKEYIVNAKASGKRFIVMYGQTEATARMSYLPWEDAEEKYSSIGVPIPGGSFSLVDADGSEISGADLDGELVYKGDNVSMGYAEGIEDLGKGDENHGTLHTGDIARRDQDGYYYITGRLKRFVKIWGNRCNLDAVEQMAKNITDMCACVGVDDKITIFVTEPDIENKITDYLSEKTGLNIRAFDVRRIDTIPKNPSGKVLYSELQKMLV